MRPGMGILCVCLATPAVVTAQEAFPGQHDLAAGLACYRNLDLPCTRARLEKALSEFSPENDPHYLQHVRQARFTLAMIYLAEDDLEKTEQEFKTLLLLDPDFELPPGERPPKAGYVLKRARNALTSRHPKANRPPVAAKQDLPDPPSPPLATFYELPARQARAQAPAPPDSTRWFLAASARLVGLFGSDAESVSSGPGASLAFGFRSPHRLMLELSLAYGYHPMVGENPALQFFSLVLEGLAELGLPPLRLRVGGGLGVLSMGTRDRYDHWGLVLQATVALVWPVGKWWAVVAGLHPSVVVGASSWSAFLPVGLSGEVRW